MWRDLASIERLRLLADGGSVGGYPADSKVAALTSPASNACRLTPPRTPITRAGWTS
jgi:hypothetical protein